MLVIPETVDPPGKRLLQNIVIIHQPGLPFPYLYLRIELSGNKRKHLPGHLRPRHRFRHRHDPDLMLVKYIPEGILLPVCIGGEFSVYVEKSNGAVRNLHVYGGLQKCRISRKNRIGNVHIIHFPCHLLNLHPVTCYFRKMVRPGGDHFLKDPVL